MLKIQEDVVPDDHVVFLTGNTIYFKTLDLNHIFEDITKQLDGYWEL